MNPELAIYAGNRENHKDERRGLTVNPKPPNLQAQVSNMNLEP
jgi:hypothetical protein